MKSYSSREIKKSLEADGWYEVGTVGSHHQYKHPTKRTSDVERPTERYTH